MIVRHSHTVHELLSALARPTEEMRTLPLLLTLSDWLLRPPSCQPDPTVGHFWTCCSHCEFHPASERRRLHQKHREKGELPHDPMGPETHWTKSGWQCFRLWLEVPRGLGRGTFGFPTPPCSRRPRSLTVILLKAFLKAA
jgi:hypothetical protein